MIDSKYGTKEKFALHIKPVPGKLPSNCLEWQGCRSGGYGIAFTSSSERWRAHRLAWTLFIGPIPQGKTLHHKCENKACCNVEHLQIVTGQEHHAIHDPWNARARRGKTHCVRGHEFTSDNTQTTVGMDGRTRRRCIACAKIPVPERRPVAPERKKTGLCKKGHEYTPENTIAAGVYRYCKTCRTKYLADWHQKNKERRNKAASERNQLRHLSQ